MSTKIGGIYQSHSRARSSILGTATTATKKPLFAPTRSPTPIKRGSSQVPLQLPSLTPSPLKPQPKLQPTSATSEKVVPSNSARRVLSPSVSPDPEEESETSEVEVLSNSDEELDEGSLEDESESDEESELGGSGRMRASRYLDCYAEEARSTKPNTQFQRAAVEGEDRW
ncbi:hypothetical protein FRC08_006968, partial [Ceratobasidium sp. 394]